MSTLSSLKEPHAAEKNALRMMASYILNGGNHMAMYTSETGAATQLMQHVDRIIRLPEVKRLTGYGRSTIYNRLNPKSKGYDPDFPRPVSLSPFGAARGIKGWRMSEVMHWCATRPYVEARHSSLEGSKND